MSTNGEWWKESEFREWWKNTYGPPMNDQYCKAAQAGWKARDAIAREEQGDDARLLLDEKHTNAALREELSYAQERIEKLEEVLKWYAEPRNYFGGLCQETVIGKDSGAIARQTLEAAKAIEGVR